MTDLSSIISCVKAESEVLDSNFKNPGQIMINPTNIINVKTTEGIYTKLYRNKADTSLFTAISYIQAD